jgi:hypothetical protein
VPGDSGGGSPKLVAAYGFDETSADTAVLDASGNANHGSFLNARRVTRAKFGQALAFKGSNSLVTVSDSASLDLTTGMTLSAWIFPFTELSNWKSIITKERTGGLAYALHANSGSAKPNLTLFISGRNRHLNAGSKVPANRWTHLAATYDGLTQRVFVNGVQVGSRSQKGTIEATANPLRIGGNTVTGRYFRGVIDEVRIYDGALSQADIVTVSNQPVNP